MIKVLFRVCAICVVTFGMYGCFATISGGASKGGSVPIAQETINGLTLNKTSYDQAVQVLGLPLSVDNCCGQAWIAHWITTTSGSVGVSVPGIGGGGGTAIRDHLELYFNPKTKILIRIEQYKTQTSTVNAGI